MKRLAKMPYSLERAEEFEQAYLHLAHLYVERGKFDLAQVISDLAIHNAPRLKLHYAIWNWLVRVVDPVLISARLQSPRTNCAHLPGAVPSVLELQQVLPAGVGDNGTGDGEGAEL